ncbi:MAG TPA: hypothetical protein VJR02_17300 [Pyrinomonadaceae bacterium]|nr:hypothetical protein [Pyrinomonadaceae bacterium]
MLVTLGDRGVKTRANYHIVGENTKKNGPSRRPKRAKVGSVTGNCFNTGYDKSLRISPVFAPTGVCVFNSCGATND